MQIACNLSNELMELIDEEKVSVDFVKIALSKSDEGIPEKYRRYGKLLLHGVGTDVSQHTGAKQAEHVNWEKIREKAAFCGSGFIGLHCGAYLSDWDGQEVTFDKVKERMGHTLGVWKANAGTDIQIENLPYTAYYEMNNPFILRYSVLPEMITALCSEHHVGLLLDLAHAKVTASGLNIPLMEYLKALPLHLVREIHVVGTRSTEDGLRDNHLEMEDADYAVLESVLKMTDPEIVTLEYGGFGEHFSWRSDKDAIERQLKRIRQIVQS